MALRECKSAAEVLANYRQVRNRVAAWKAYQPASPPPVEPEPEPVAAPVPEPEALCETPEPLSLALIRREVCRYYALNLAVFCGPRRTKGVAKPRHVFCFLGRELMTCSLTQIAALVGGRDHTTIFHGAQRIRECLP